MNVAAVGLYNRVGVSVAAAPGLGAITLGSPLTQDATINAPPWQSFTAASIPNGRTVRYLALDTGAWEYGPGVYNAGVLSRPASAMDGTVAGQKSSTGSLLSLSASAQVFITSVAEDIGSKTLLTDDTLVLYVRPGGADNVSRNGFPDNDANAFATASFAWNIARQRYDWNGHDVTIQLQTGQAWTATIAIAEDYRSRTGHGTGGRLILDGGNGTVIVNNNHCIEVKTVLPSNVKVQNFYLSTTGAAGSCIAIAYYGTLEIGEGMEFGPAVSSHKHAEDYAVILDGPDDQIVSGGAPTHLSVDTPFAWIFQYGASVTITGTPTFDQWAYASGGGHIWNYNGVTAYTGSISGYKTGNGGLGNFVASPDDFPGTGHYASNSIDQTLGWVVGNPTGGLLGPGTINTENGAFKNGVEYGTGAAYTTENAQDDIGTILVDSATIDFTYNDATPSITAIVIDNSITDAKLRQGAALSVIGRSANTLGNVADIAAASDGQVLRRSGTSIGFGAVDLASANAITGDLPFANLTQGSARSVLGVTGNAGADVASIQGTTDQVLRINGAGTALAFGAIDVSKAAAITGILLAAAFPILTGDVTTAGGALATTIANDAVTYAKMQNISATSRILGRITAGAGDTEELTGANVRTIAGLATTDNPQFATIELGAASDTTLARSSAGNVSIEGNVIYRAGGTDVTLADGGTGASLADPNIDRLMGWDDSAGAVKFMALADYNTEATPASGDYLLMVDAAGNLLKTDWANLPGAGGGIANVVEDTTPQLGGDLDTNGFNIGFDDNHGITDDAGNKLLWFQTPGVGDYFEIQNATAVPTLSAVGSSTDITMKFKAKGAGGFQFDAGDGPYSGVYFYNTDATGAGPVFYCLNDTVSPAAGDYPFGLEFQSRNSSAAIKTYGSMYVQLLDPVAGSEDGQFEFYTRVGGATPLSMTLYTGLQLGAPTGGDKGSGTLNTAGEHYVNNNIVYRAGKIEFADNTGIKDDSGNNQLVFQKTASAVNYWEMENNATSGAAPSANPITLRAAGSDANINLVFQVKSDGAVIPNNIPMLFDLGAANYPVVSYTNTSAGDGGPIHFLYHNSASPAAGDYPGGLVYKFNNTSAARTEACSIYAHLLDATAGSEDAEFEIYARVGGASVVVGRISDGWTIGSAPTGGYKGAGTINSSGSMYVNNNIVYRAAGTDVALADGGTGASLTDPNADRIMFWDDSAGAVDWLAPDSTLTISGTTLSGTAASTTQAGVMETATFAEVVTGTDTGRAISPDSQHTKIVHLSSQHSVSSTTATEVTGLQATLVAGTYRYNYFLIVRTSASADGLKFGINYTGTTTKIVTTMQWPDTGTTATLGAIDDSANGTIGQIVAHSTSRAKSTTAPDMNTGTAGAATQAVDLFIEIKGVIVVSDGGDFELWHASESTNATTVEVGSSLTITRVN